MKNSALRFKTDSLLETANNFDEWYTIGYQFQEIGQLIRHMAIHMGDLQKKVDSQAEELRKRQDKMAEMHEEINEFEIQTGLMQNRTYYNKFVKEVFHKEKGSDLIYPDFDEIYKRYFELLHQRDKIVEQLEAELSKAEERYHRYADEDGLSCMFDMSDMAEKRFETIKEMLEIVKGGNT